MRCLGTVQTEEPGDDVRATSGAKKMKQTRERTSDNEDDDDRWFIHLGDEALSLFAQHLAIGLQPADSDCLSNLREVDVRLGDSDGWSHIEALIEPRAEHLHEKNHGQIK